jgi:diguanylate cyclase (GGDEF)-like protein
VGTVTTSIGVAELQADESLDDWLERADQALYEAKSGGRNAVRAALAG